MSALLSAISSKSWGPFGMAHTIRCQFVYHAIMNRRDESALRFAREQLTVMSTTQPKDDPHGTAMAARLLIHWGSCIAATRLNRFEDASEAQAQVSLPLKVFKAANASQLGKLAHQSFGDPNPTPDLTLGEICHLAAAAYDQLFVMEGEVERARQNGAEWLRASGGSDVSSYFKPFVLARLAALGAPPVSDSAAMSTMSEISESMLALRPQPQFRLAKMFAITAATSQDPARRDLFEKASRAALRTCFSAGYGSVEQVRSDPDFRSLGDLEVLESETATKAGQRASTQRSGEK